MKLKFKQHFRIDIKRCEEFRSEFDNFDFI